MAEKMKALIQYGPMDNRYEDVDIPNIGHSEILLKVKGCGICAGDIKAYHGGIRIWGTNEKNRYIEAPVIGGHEFFGEVAQVGENVTEYKIGDLLTAEQIVPCNLCSYCREGKYWMCTRSAVYGFKQYANGGFAEYIKLHKNSILHRIPNDFTDEQAVLIEPLACGMHAVELAEIRHSDIVVISGLGAIGTAMVNMAKLYLPRLVIGLDIMENRLEIGKRYGADYVWNPVKSNIKRELEKLTDKGGCNVYIEASGSPGSVNQGIDLLCNHGRYVQMGVFAKEVTTDWNVIGDGKELTIKGSHLSAMTYDSVIKGIRQGLLHTDGLITHKYRLKDWKEAFETAQKDPYAMKVMLIPCTETTSLL